MKEIIFRKATPEDIPHLVECRIRFTIEYAGEQSTEDTEELRKQMTSYFSKAMAEDLCISYIAWSGSDLAGIGSAAFREQPGNFKNPSGKWAYIMNMYTLPEYRKKGICTGILQRLVEAVKGKGIIALELHATEEGEPIYTRNGFNRHHEPTLRKYLS
jgi:GNAT superfamily N-acetyltransferase